MANNGTFERTKYSNRFMERLQTLSVLTNRLALSQNLGLSHNGDRDLYNSLGYPKEVKSEDLIARWGRQGIARALVDRPVKKTWQGPIALIEPEQEQETALQKEFDTLNDELGLKEKLLRVDRLAQLGSFSILLLGFDDSSQENWPQPVSSGNRKLLYVRPISRRNVEIDTYETDFSNPRYGKPRIYRITLNHPNATGNDISRTKTLKVHYSRLIHIAFDLLEDDIEGNPVMEAAYNRLMDLEKLVGGSAEMFWRGARPGYFGNSNPDYKIDEATEEKLMDQLDEYENNLRRFLVAEGVDLQSLAQQIADPKGHVETQIMMISAVTNIPARILIGSERGQLASSQDEANFKEYISIRRTEEVEPLIFRPLIDRLIEVGVLTKPINPDLGYSVQWSDLFSLGEKEKADIGDSRAGALAKYSNAPMAEQQVPLEPFLKYFLQMDDDQIADIITQRDSQMSDMLSREASSEQINPNSNPLNA